MNNHSEISTQLRELFPGASENLLAFFQLAQDNAGALRADFYTIRDWLEIANYKEDTLHVLLLLLILAQDEGSLCIELSRESFTRRLTDLVPADQVLEWADRLADDLARNDYSKLIGTIPLDHRPIIRHRAAGREYLYFQKFLRHELEFAQSFRAKLQEPQVIIPGANLEAIMGEVLTLNPLRQGGQPLVLDPDQRLALERSLSRSLVLISGGPGTGKTSIVLTLLRCLVRMGVAPDRIALAAPTGRAAQRLADAIRMGLHSLPQDTNSPDAQLQGMRATTLHQLLEYVPSSDLFRRHAENPLPAEVVIVDEVSMVGMVMMARLFQAVRPQTRIILLGDKDQLPSVDAGAVLANLMSSQESAVYNTSPIQDALVLLRTNHRSQAHIRALAAAVNQQNLAVLDDLPILAMSQSNWSHLAGERGVYFLEQIHQNPPEMRRMLQCWAEYAYLGSGFPEALAQCKTLSDDGDSPRSQDILGKLFSLLDKTRLLTLVRAGPWGCVDINRFLDQVLRPRLDRNSRGVLFHGAPVLVTRNDPGRGLFNGDVGITLRGPEGGLRAIFPRQGSYLSLPADALPAHELGFALTVHKSQGSEYGQVMLVFPPTGGRKLLTKELVYTGITRAKDLVILCATREVLRMAIQKKCTRESGMLLFD